MQIPSIVGRIGAGVDVEPARGGVEHNLRRARRLLIEEQEFLEFDVFQDAGNRPESLSRCRQRHLDISRARKNNRAADAMVLQITQVCRIQLHVPGRLRCLEPVSQQGVTGQTHAHSTGVIGFPPMAFRLERV
jgi:hypothetical protein